MKEFYQSTGYKKVEEFFLSQGFNPHRFQIDCWYAYNQGLSGLIHTATGSGKTYAALMGHLIEAINNANSNKNEVSGLKLLWITPLRALANDTLKTVSYAVSQLIPDYNVELRTGDTSQSKRAKQAKQLPEIFITTPESLSLLISYPNFFELFSGIKSVVIDEWHELLGSKRGVLTELGLARLKRVNPELKIWGISATLGNTATAMEVLLGNKKVSGKLIGAGVSKNTEIETLIPETIENFPWAGHTGLKMIEKVCELIDSANSCLVFTNTRSQSEIWYQAILEQREDFAGIIGLHHGSIEKKERNAVENLLSEGKMKCVICTSSLDLGVDFSPVDLVIQIGSPKGIARLLQRAGRSGHKPGGVSKLVCVPANSLELIEFAAVREGIMASFIEPREPVVKAFDVLVQHAVTVAIGTGFNKNEFFNEVKSTHCYRELTHDEFDNILEFVCKGGKSLRAYKEFAKVKFDENFYFVDDKQIAKRHRMAIGTITSEPEVIVKYMNGTKLGTLEESFAARLSKGDNFIFSGKSLEFVRLRDLVLYVKKSNSGEGPVPQWLGGRMPLSTMLAKQVRERLNNYPSENSKFVEITAISPLLELQKKWSEIPSNGTLLVERKLSDEGMHLFFYPFEGRLVHEGLASLLAYRIGKNIPASFSLAYDDYGFELLTDTEFELAPDEIAVLFSEENLIDDILQIINSSEMTKSKFRDVARIAGLIFQGYPGSNKPVKQIQATGSLFFEVFTKYDPDNLLLKQAVREVLESQLERKRMIETLKRICKSQIILRETKYFTPLSFPLMASRIREKYSTQKVSERIKKMQIQLEKAVLKSK
ncbi:MAG: ligase-associated DNA damage response DEXH box helicase [Ignavibacteriaceae bacterium]|nr:ligase-associated DNA damage response DEXH box helicase [Ignavibacteriaceae bacterium]